MNQSEIVTKIAEIQAKQAQNKVEQESNQANGNQLSMQLRGLKADLAEAKKPKLSRDGDYAVREKSDLIHIMAGGDIFNNFNGVNPCGYDPKIDFYQGNIFDDLTALQEDVTKFEMKVENTSVTSGKIIVGQTCDPTDLTFLHIPNRMNMLHMTLAEFETFTMNCRKKLATLKRKEAMK